MSNYDELEARIDYYISFLDMVRLAKKIDKQQLGLLSMVFDLKAMEDNCKKILKRLRREKTVFKENLERIKKNV